MHKINIFVCAILSTTFPVNQAWAVPLHVVKHGQGVGQSTPPALFHDSDFVQKAKTVKLSLISYQKAPKGTVVDTLPIAQSMTIESNDLKAFVAQTVGDAIEAATSIQPNQLGTVKQKNLSNPSKSTFKPIYMLEATRTGEVRTYLFDFSSLKIEDSRLSITTESGSRKTTRNYSILRPVAVAFDVILSNNNPTFIARNKTTVVCATIDFKPGEKIDQGTWKYDTYKGYVSADEISSLDIKKEPECIKPIASGTIIRSDEIRYQK